jgi:hypothetical protein
VYEYCSPDRNYNTSVAAQNPNNFSTLNNGPQLILSPDTLNGLTYVIGMGPSTAQSYALSGSNLTGGGNLLISASTHYELSLNGGAFGQNVLVPFGSGIVTGQPVTLFVRLKAGLPVGVYANQFQVHSGGGAVANLVCNGEVKATTSAEEWGAEPLPYPNPMKTEAFVFVSMNGSYEVTWYDMSGKTLRSEILETSGATSTITLHRENLPSGMYLVKLQTKDNVRYIRLAIRD